MIQDVIKTAARNEERGILSERRKNRKEGLLKSHRIGSNGADTWQGDTSLGGNWDDKLNFDFYIFTDHVCLVPKF